MTVEKCNVLGIGISVIDQDRAREFLFYAVRSRRRGYVAVANVHSVSEEQHDAELRQALNGALLATPDGVPLVWMGRLQGHADIRRVYGPDLMVNICGHSVAEGFSHFLYGGGDGVADELSAALEHRFPGLRIVGTFTPPFRPLTTSERTAFQAQIAAARPDFL